MFDFIYFMHQIIPNECFETHYGHIAVKSNCSIKGLEKPSIEGGATQKHSQFQIGKQMEADVG